jgi:hypothetical protein
LAADAGRISGEIRTAACMPADPGPHPDQRVANNDAAGNMGGLQARVK